MTWCGFEWVTGDDVHLCAARGEHTTHECADDGCHSTVSVAVRGGRARGKAGQVKRFEQPPTLPQVALQSVGEPEAPVPR